MARPPLVPEALRNTPFRGTAAIAAGLVTAHQLRSVVWRRLFHDVYVHAGIPDTHLLHILAAQLIIPSNAIITGRSAATIWGVGLASAHDPVEVLSPRYVRPQPGLAIRRGTIDPAEITSVGGVPTPKPPHVAWEIARAYSAVDAIAWLDALAKVKRLDAADLVRHARRHFGEYGGRRAAATLALVDRRAESPPESRLRIHLHEAGFPAPKPQWNVYVDGKFMRVSISPGPSGNSRSSTTASGTPIPHNSAVTGHVSAS